MSEAHVEEIRNLSSYRGMELFVDKGEMLKKTIDCFTWAGTVQLWNADEELLERDIRRIREMENTTALFILE